jgi:hypothetical protein
VEKRRLSVPSPAFVVSLIALFVALGGTTYAATSLPTNSVGAKQLRKNAVTSPKIKAHAVSASKINTHGLTVPNAVHAATAGSATKATDATTVGGQTVQLIQWKAPPSTASQTIFSAQGLTITGSCDASSNITVDAAGSTAQNAELRIEGNVGGTDFWQNFHLFSDTSTVSLVQTDGAQHEGAGQLVYATVDGHVVTLSYGFDWGSSASPAYSGKFVGCTLYGEAVSG